MISVTKLRTGIVFEHKGDPWRVTEYKHVHLSRGSGTINVKARNLKSGSVQNITFKSGERIEETQVEKKRFTYLYSDPSSLYFMDPVTFEQVELPLSLADDKGDYLVEGSVATVIYWESQPLGIEIPPKVTLKVASASPGVRGDTVAGATKEAVLQTGKTIKVPLFIKEGDQIIIDTRDGGYVSRA